MTLSEIYQKHFDGTWPDLFTVHSYGDVYEEILAPYRTTAKNILEIGLFTGARLKIWEEYFTGTVHGIDCDEQPHGGMADLRPMIASGKHNIHIFDACDTKEIERRFKGITFDIVIDDAAHSLEQNLTLFEAWKPYMNKGGLYIIEDIGSIDETRSIYEGIAPGQRVEILDLRNKKNRFDDVLVLIHF